MKPIYKVAKPKKGQKARQRRKLSSTHTHQKNDQITEGIDWRPLQVPNDDIINPVSKNWENLSKYDLLFHPKENNVLSFPNSSLSTGWFKVDS